MEPYYQDDHTTIYHGDCEEVLSGLPGFDLVLADPPYGIGEARNNNASRGKMATARDYGVASWDDKPISDALIRRVVSHGKYAIVFGGNYYSLPPSPCWLVWDKDNGECDFADCELAWTNLSGAVRRLKYRWAGMLQEHQGRHREMRFHPTQKPVRVMVWCLEKSKIESGSTVFDPFMGVGSTLLAARDWGCKSVGIEREEKYCEIAAERLRQKVLF